MKVLRLTSFLFAVLSSSIIIADVEIGKVYGDKTWIAYIGSGSQIYIRNGSTDFALKCNTGFKSLNDQVQGPNGEQLTSKNSVLTAIQRNLVQGKYKSQGCK